MDFSTLSEVSDYWNISTFYKQKVGFVFSFNFYIPAWVGLIGVLIFKSIPREK